MSYLNMRIVSWNCCWQKGGFTDEKRNEILRLRPDILLVQECKQEDWLKLGFSDKNGHWYGDGKEAKGDPNKNPMKDKFGVFNLTYLY